MQPRRPPENSPHTPRWRIALTGTLLAGVVLGGGVLGEWVRLGWDEAAALQRIERSLRADLTARAEQLRLLAERLAAAPEITAALAQPAEPGEAPFEAIETLLGPRPDNDRAVTAYAASGAPIAWYGRPSALPAERIAGSPSTFVAPGPMGLRLVHVAPVVGAGSHAPRRLGAVAAEHVVSASAIAREPGRGFRLDGLMVPVLLHPRATGEAPRGGAIVFDVPGPDGDVLVRASVTPEDVQAARRSWRSHVAGAAVTVVALTLVVLAASVCRRPWPSPRHPIEWLAIVGLLLLARGLLWAGLPPRWRLGDALGDADGSAVWRVLLASPLDLILTAVLAAAVTLVAFEMLEAWRISGRVRTLRDVASRWPRAIRASVHLAAGACVAVLLVGFERVLPVALGSSVFDVLDLSVLPWDPPRAVTFGGLLLLHAALLGVAVVVFRAASAVTVGPQCPRADRVAMLTAWIAPALATWLAWSGTMAPAGTLPLGAGVAASVAWLLPASMARLRRASSARRALILGSALVASALALHPGLSAAAERGRQQAVSSRFAVQAMQHPEELQRRLNEALEQIDAMPALVDLLEALQASAQSPGPEAAFSIWQQTALAEARLTSSVELYGQAGSLVSRFALNFPDDEPLNQPWHGASCSWEVYGEAAPFGAEERRMLHAERGVCDADGEPRGGIVVHLMLDYSALPFLSSPSPYAEAFRTPVAGGWASSLNGESLSLVIYGWGRTPIYASRGRAWPLDDALFGRVYASREPFWTRVRQARRTHKVYFANDRFAIYAVGYAEPSWFEHGESLAELVIFAAMLAAVLAAVAWLAWRVADPGRGAGSRVGRRFRNSFSRKLFLAFVAASVVPVLVLAFTIRLYVASRLRSDVEAEAARTVAVAQRFIQDWLALAERGEFSPLALTDEVMVWISRVIDQDVNIFAGTHLVATSERDLFASGLLSTRVPDRVYRAIVLRRLTSYVGEDEIGRVRYLMAAAPIRAGSVEAILTVPLALKQREIEREIHEFDRGVQLGALVFILLGAGVGYWLSQRIADPVERLTRASRRIAAGELSARVLVRTADELQRLVESFNSMAVELERQRAQLEHTNRLEAWAEMARQVAHDIKNPLTPIQLSAEHLQRVHKDRGEPLSPVLDRCVQTILTQVRLLRRISSDFASFASTPTVKREPTDMNALLREVAEAYGTGLGDRVRLIVDLEEQVPMLSVDRILIGRAITNVMENALYAMPEGGDLRLSARVEGPALVIEIRDTGVGMEAADVARAFDPSFSTKVTGSGLGLPIARRNVELHGGSVAVRSTPGSGTSVTFRLPLDPADALPASEVPPDTP